ncbi:hypothetical protein GO986_09565 [Deinococcus sp. HMF7620]|uniref:Uncharacterized protein n=1 Tax=Deinococcus arboris TaxID=2682977 RepID=A0A7C9HRP8_9DEIO|nr:MULTISPECIES: hypothetical protein [Deinococcus]MBZ9750825.1 hypothetical protein [Deinococcus betulae]MVN87013.1 hypothetical protein [Deinococcus arboris]
MKALNLKEGAPGGIPVWLMLTVIALVVGNLVLWLVLHTPRSALAAGAGVLPVN